MHPTRPAGARRDWRGVAWVSAVGLSCGLAALLNPAWLLRVSAKEGAAEVAGQVVLLAAVVGWALVQTRAGRGAAWVAAACGIVLAEELDWGAQLGFDGVVDLLGMHNLHNSLGGASYLAFAVPWVLLYAAALRGVREPRWVPPPTDALAFGLVVAAAGASLAVPGVWEQALDELSGLMLYTLLAVSGTRYPRSSNATRQRAPRAPSPVR